MNDAPLVSIVIYNYNYGRYLSACFDSVINQTYQNIEIIFSDNASTDESWEIAQSYNQKFPNLFFVARNRQNFGPAANARNCLINIRGKYTIFLGSDDVIKPHYISTCVFQLEKHGDAAFAMVHRSVIDSKGKETFEEPFYDDNYKLYPPSQVGVYFMSSINPTISQVFYRSDLILRPVHLNTLNDLYFGHRFVDFILCLEKPIIYLKEAFVAHRVHADSHSREITENLIQIIGNYILNFQLKEMSTPYNFKVIDEKFGKSIKKISELSLRYSTEALINSNTKLAKKYWHLAIAIDPDIENSELAQTLSQVLNTKDHQLIASLGVRFSNNLRSTSYRPDPPFEHL